MDNANGLKEKTKNIIYIVVSFLIVVSAYFVNINFKEDLPRKLSESVFWLVVPILIFSIITLMTKRSVFSIWAKMTNYFFISSVVIVLLTPTSTHGLDFFPVVKETVTIALASSYSIISLILVLYKSFKKE